MTPAVQGKSSRRKIGIHVELTKITERAPACRAAGKTSGCVVRWHWAVWLCCICALMACGVSGAALAAQKTGARQIAQNSAVSDSPSGNSAAASGAASTASGGEATPAAKKESGQNGPVEVRELWTGGLYSSTYRVGVCFSAQGKVRGVVHLRLYNGKVDVYHIEGEVKNNEIVAHHSSGHSFKGHLLSSDAVEGDISLKNGMKVHLEGKRTHDASLAPEDCAPLPQ